MFPKTQPMTPLVVPTKMKFSHLAHLAAALTWRPVHALLFWRRFCISSAQTDLQLPHARADVCMWALILCAFQSIVGNFEAVPFLGLYFRVCRLPFISVSFAHCGYPSRSPCGSERCWNTRGSPIAVPYLFQFLTLPLTWLSDLASLWVFSSMTGIFLPTSHNPACLQPRVLDVSFLPFCRHWSLWSLIDSPRQSRGLK